MRKKCAGLGCQSCDKKQGNLPHQSLGRKNVKKNYFLVGPYKQIVVARAINAGFRTIPKIVIRVWF